MIDELNKKVAGIPQHRPKEESEQKPPSPPNPRTRAEIDTLKRKWERSAEKWQLELTEGFEDHKTELFVFRQAHEEKQKQKDAQQKERQGQEMRGEVRTRGHEDADEDNEDNEDSGHEEVMQKMCPIGMLQGRGVPCACAAEDCAWWIGEENACVVALHGIFGSLR